MEKLLLKIAELLNLDIENVSTAINLDENMPDQTIQAINTIAGIFPEWFKTAIMMIIAMISAAIISLAKSKYAGIFKFSIWISNILLAMVMAFLIDSLALWAEPNLNIRAEMALMVLSGMLAKDILEIAEHKGLKWLSTKAGGDSDGSIK